MRASRCIVARPNSGPQLSVVVPVRGRAELLTRCLRALADQTLNGKYFEVLVCDDGSDPALGPTDQPAASGRVVWLRQTAKGPAAARNLGVQRARAKIVAFVDSDVELDPGCLSALLRGLDANPNWQGAEARLEPYGSECGPLWDAPSSLQGGHFHTAAIAYRKAALRHAGGFDERFAAPACEDVELAVRVLEQGPIGFVGEAVARHPTRRVTAITHWRWRQHWYYATVLAVRYGIVAFPDRNAGQWPRVRIAWSALITLPTGRALAALAHVKKDVKEGVLAMLYAGFDVVVGLTCLPAILCKPVPERQDYLMPGATEKNPSPARVNQ